MVERLVREFDPVRIILFGSHARGDANEHSDVDLLVVLPHIEDRADTSAALRSALGDVPLEAHAFPSDPEEIRRTGDRVGSFVYPVLREGRVIYGVDDRDQRVWLRYAEEDLDAAERMVEQTGFALRWACYLSQQAAEKALKAVLVAEQIPFPFIHELDKLRDLVPPHRRVARVEADLKGLSEWVNSARYPGEPEEATEEVARACIADATRVVEAAREDVGGKG
jgi:HEPN domain-containing protein